VFAGITERGLERLAETTSTHLAGVRRRFLSRLSKTQTEQMMNMWDGLLAKEHESDPLGTTKRAEMRELIDDDA
jgi:hypothetical protein